MLEFILVFGIFALIFGGIPYADNIIREHRYNKNVKACINEQTRYLRLTLYRIQNDLEIESEYQLTDKDITGVDVILNEFKESLSADFLSNKLPKYTKSIEESKMLYLRDFAIKNQDEMQFGGFEMYLLDESTRNNYICKYNLTEFAITYHKVLGILQTYYVKCKKITNENSSAIYEIKIIQETIDKGWTR